MDTRKLLCNIVGVAVGGGLMYGLVKKSGLEKQARTLSATLVEGSAIAGGVFVGYHLSNLVAVYLLPGSSAGVDALPEQQVDSLPSGETPVSTPTAETAMGNVQAKAQAVTPVATPSDVAGGNVIDITKAKGQNND
jgi:hypothetical protein